MKKIFLYFILLLGAHITYAATTTKKIQGIYYTLDTSTMTAEVRAGSNSNEKYSGQIDIPETVTYNSDVYTVTSIGFDAFFDCKELIRIKIPNSVTSIGGSAFNFCSGLLKVEIPNSVTSIGGSAFRNCSSLISVEIPNSVTSIEMSTFDGCSSLTSVVIPNSVTSIGGSAFSDCSGLTSVEIANSVTSIGSSAFSGCSGITEFILPNTISSILSLSTPPNIQSLGIPASVESCYANNFQNTKALYLFPTNPPSITGTIQPKILFYCTLYVPEASIEQYKTADGWKDFLNILPLPEHQTKNLTNKIQYLDNDGYEINNHAVTLSLPTPEEREGYQFLKWTVLQSDLEDGIHIQAQYIGEGTEKNLFYLDKDGEEMHSHAVILTLPDPEEIPGYTFQKWVVVGGDLDDGIHVQAQYIDNGLETEVSSMMEYDSIANQKVIRKGQVFILKGDKVFDTSGKEVK